MTAVFLMQFLWDRYCTEHYILALFFGHFKKALSLQKENDGRCGESNTDKMKPCATVREPSVAEIEIEIEREGERDRAQDGGEKTRLVLMEKKMFIKVFRPFKATINQLGDFCSGISCPVHSRVPRSGDFRRDLC